MMTVLLLVLGCGQTWARGAIIIDHRCTDINRIPQRAINQAKAALHIAYGHTSHGSQVTDGMSGLVAFANGGGKGLDLPENIFAWSHDDQSPAKLHLYEGSGSSSGDLELDGGYYPSWVNETRAFLGEPSATTGRGTLHPEFNVIMWSWCGQISGKYAAGTLDDEYLNPMASLEADYPGITFVYMTGHVDIANDANNKGANQMVRDFCRANGKVLFDFAAFDAHDPDGTFYEFVHDTCDYYTAPLPGGTKLGNWALEWQDSHTLGVDWYNCGADHSKPLNANQKAYAVWWLWARLAGWPGPAGCLPAVQTLLLGSH
jgi:hypothetical protein